VARRAACLPVYVSARLLFARINMKNMLKTFRATSFPPTPPAFRLTASAVSAAFFKVQHCMGHPHPFCAAASFRIFASQKCKLISWARLRKKRVGVAPTVIHSPYIYIFYIFFFLPVACMKFNGSHFVVVVVATPGTPLCKTFRAVLACELCIRIFLACAATLPAKKLLFLA